MQFCRKKVNREHYLCFFGERIDGKESKNVAWSLKLKIWLGLRLSRLRGTGQQRNEIVFSKFKG